MSKIKLGMVITRIVRVIIHYFLLWLADIEGFRWTYPVRLPSPVRSEILSNRRYREARSMSFRRMTTVWGRCHVPVLVVVKGDSEVGWMAAISNTTGSYSV